MPSDRCGYCYGAHHERTLNAQRRGCGHAVRSDVAAAFGCVGCRRDERERAAFVAPYSNRVVSPPSNGYAHGRPSTLGTSNTREPKPRLVMTVSANAIA